MINLNYIKNTEMITEYICSACVIKTPNNKNIQLINYLFGDYDKN